MKTNIHPQWYPEAFISCACGNAFKVGSTKNELHVDICSKCHPFFTGEMRYADTEGKVDRFQKKVASAKTLAPIIAKRKAKKANQVVDDDTPKSLKEMLLGAQ